MSEQALFISLSDAVLIIHVLFVFFVVFGLVAIYLGYFLNWSWVRNRIFRVIHLLAIGIVVIESWLGVVCPLTLWEMELRAKAGAGTYSGSFIHHWLQSLLYYNAPEWVFMVLYTVFGGIVIASWYVVRPDKHRQQ